VKIFNHQHVMSVPRHIAVGGGATGALLSVLQEVSSEAIARNVVFVCSGGNTLAYASKLNGLAAEICSSCVTFIYQINGASSESVQKLEAYCSKLNTSPLLVGVGGGSCIDVVKLVAYRRKLPLFIYPTVLSSDCLASPVSVLEDNGRKIRTHASIPDGIFIDTKITALAPRNLILSGVCDLMSNASALLDIELFHENYKDIQFAQLISQTSISHVLAHKKILIDKSKYQKALAQGLILSGLSMNFAESSVTASGGEHLVCHALDFLGEGNATHGEQVYLGMLCCNLIRRHLGYPTISKKILNLLESYKIPDKIQNYSITQDGLMAAIRRAPSLRQERKTVLSCAEDIPDDKMLEILSPLF